MNVKVGIIGFGEMGKRHARDMEEFSEGHIKIAGVVELSDRKFDIGVKWLGHVPERFTSAKAMLDKISPDGIIIATPNSLHLECLKELTGKRIPLILEKPLDTGLGKVKEIVDFAKHYKAPIMVHHVMRYSPIVLKAKEILDSGAIGELCGFCMVQFIEGGMFHNFRRTFKTGGGQLLEKATHDFDVLLFLTGRKPRSVFATCKRQYFGGEKSSSMKCSGCEESDKCRHNIFEQKKHDTVSGNDLCVFADEIDIFDNESCLIELDNGIFGTYSECFFSRAPFSRRYEFNGSHGFLSMDFSGGKVFLRTLRGEESFDFDYHGRIHYNGAPGVVKHFLSLINGTETVVRSSVDSAAEAELISFAAYKSNETRRMVNMEEISMHDQV